jgi:beta-glucosidase
MPVVRNGDMKTICQPLDFYGVNIYFDETVRGRPSGGYEVVKNRIGPPLTMMPWEVTPEALYWGPKFLFERYRLPIVVTENGMANCDWICLDGKVHDPQRIDFLTRYLGAYHRSIAGGVVAQGYFVWSVMDNFEWGHGYKQRFGLIYVDYASQQRVLKDSAHWYGKVIAANGAGVL